MACACQGRTAMRIYVWTGPDGRSREVTTLNEAQALVDAKGGSYRLKS